MYVAAEQGDLMSVWKKIAQNVSQPIFLSNSTQNYVHFTLEKSIEIFLATFVIKKTASSKQSTKRRKFDQSGHPAAENQT
jgi:hypothetical protein